MEEREKVPVLTVNNLLKIYPAKRSFFFLKEKLAAFTAVDHISFHLHEGEILGLLGANGAGKTTTIHILLGILTPTSGQIHYFGRDFYQHRAELIRSIAHASAYTKLSAPLTIAENLDIIGRLYGLSAQERNERMHHLMKLFGIEGLRGKQAGSLSAGQMTRVMLVKAFISKPKIVLLDEPTASLDPDMASEVREFILKMQKEEKISVILTSHNMQEVALMCNRALVMKDGVIIEEDTPQMLARKGSISEVSFYKLSAVERVVSFCEENKCHYRMQDGKMTIMLVEQKIAPLLMELARIGIIYENIEIKQPTLDDYFVKMVRK